MMPQTEYAIRLAANALRNPELIWKGMDQRISADAITKARELTKKPGPLDVNLPGGVGWALQQYATFSFLRRWAAMGFPLATLSEADALALSVTDPPAWLVTSPHGDDEQTPLGVEFGSHFSLIVDWRAGTGMWIEEDRTEPRPFEDEEAAKRFIANVGFALLERPEGLDIREHRPSPKAMRKQGRKHYPTVQYIIQAARDLYPPEPVTERGPRNEGWTMSVRTMVRGHWRQQAHGPNHSLRKIIWIRPTWRGPEDAPISIHATRLRAEEPR
jgi:hypothetical protein